MRFIATADTDIGTVKETNQDSLLIKHADTPNGEVLMTVVCDGMGGLAKGELASATVIREFSAWFDSELPRMLPNLDLDRVGEIWSNMLRRQNDKIRAYGRASGIDLGTTFTGVLFVGQQYVFVHVGDCRFYSLRDGLIQLTEDQTFVAREIRNGNMTPEQARTDKRRNVLLQCVGASPKVEPQVGRGRTAPGVYLLCSDGFRHVISEAEIAQTLAPINLMNKKAMHGGARYLIDLVKARRERDNISVIVIKAE